MSFVFISNFPIQPFSAFQPFFFSSFCTAFCTGPGRVLPPEDVFGKVVVDAETFRLLVPLANVTPRSSDYRKYKADGKAVTKGKIRKIDNLGKHEENTVSDAG